MLIYVLSKPCLTGDLNIVQSTLLQNASDLQFVMRYPNHERYPDFSVNNVYLVGRILANLVPEERPRNFDERQVLTGVHEKFFTSVFSQITFVIIVRY